MTEIDTVSNNPEVEVPADDAVIGKAFRWSLAFLFTGVSVVLVVWLLLSGEPKPPIIPQAPLQPAERRTIAGGKVELPKLPFVDVTETAGITFDHTNGATGEKLLPETMGGGVAFFDYNNDERPDLLFVNSNHWPHATVKGPEATMALYRNEGVTDGQVKYTDVTKDAGLDLTFYGMGVACGDFDNDGWVDLFFSALGTNRLLKNVEGKFSDVTETANVAGAKDAWSTCCGFFDIDNDGDLDLYVGNYVTWTAEIDRQLKCTLDGKLRAYCRPDAYAGAHPYLYRNDGGGKFTDVSEASGVRVVNPDTKVPLAKALGLAPIDADQDGWMDFIVANDTVRNLLFHNQKDGTFKEVGITCGVAYGDEGTARGAMGIDSAWFRNDRTLGIAIGNFANEPTTLFCAPGDLMSFTDYANATGIGPQSRLFLKFGVFFADLDNDGRQDLLCANGHLDEDIHKVQRSQTYEQAPQLFWNVGQKGGTEFSPLTAAQTGSEFLKPMVGRGASFADIDADGDLDVILTSVGGPPRLLRNDQATGHHWLRVTAKGKTSNRDAIGARIELICGDRTLVRQVMPTRSYLSQSELPVTFGLGKDLKPEKLVVHWPGGGTTEAAVTEVDKQIEVEQATE